MIFLARAAVRYGHHQIGTYIFKQLTEQVSSEHFHFWLACLKEMSEAEALLYSEDSNTLVTRLDKAVIHYNKAIAALKVCICLIICKNKGNKYFVDLGSKYPIP